VDFIGIGAPRCGTTWIARCLEEHPQLCISKPKETDYFRDINYYKGIDFYKSFFKHYKEGQKRGEYSTHYFFKEEVPRRIKVHNSEVKIIVCLRNPIERTYSHYRYHQARGGRVIMFDFGGIFKEEKMREFYLKPSRYYSNLKRYFDLFPRENILVLIYEDIKKDSVNFIQNVYEFLEIDKDFIPPSVEKKILIEEEGVRSQKLSKGMWQIENFFRQRNRSLYNFLKKKGFKAWKKIYSLNLSEHKESPEKRLIKPETREYLYKILESEIRNLEKLIDRDLSFWK